MTNKPEFPENGHSGGHTSLRGVKEVSTRISKCFGGIRLNSTWGIFTRPTSAFISFAGSDVMKAIYHLKSGFGGLGVACWP